MGRMNRKRHTALCIGFTPAVQRTLDFSSLEMGEVNRARSVQLSPAGKGVNLARVLKTLGADPLATGFLGGDSGRFVDHCMQGWGIDCDWVWVNEETRHCHTVIERDRGLVTELVEEAAAPDSSQWANAHALIQRHLADVHYVAVTGALPPGSPDHTYADIAAACRDAQVPFIIDSQKDPLLQVLPYQPALVKLNAHELGRTLGGDFDSEALILRGMVELMDQGACAVLVTRGADAAYLASSGRRCRFAPPQIKADNPIGSGDSVTAGLIQGLYEGGALEDAVALGLACGTANALTPRPGELDPARARDLVDSVKVAQI